MAKILGPLGSQAVSGKVITVIHQMWRGLNIVRKFTMPTIRHTDTQVARRVNFGTLSINWETVLTAEQRKTWEEMKVEIKDLWGNLVRATGLNLYQKINTVLIDAGKALKTIAPITSPMVSPTIEEVFDATENKIQTAAPDAGDVAAYAPFVDVWVAGTTISAETVANATTVKTTGVKPSITPAKNLFRHVAFIDESVGNKQSIIFLDSDGNDFMKDVKIAVLIIRYTKDGLRSTVVKSTNITIDHV